MKILVNKVIGTIAGLWLAGLPGASMAASEYEYADVLEARPIYKLVQVSVPQEQCWEEEVVRDNRNYNDNSQTSVLVSAIIGGAIGNALGHNKSSSRVGAVVGALLGRSIGRDIIRERDYNDENARVYETVQRCKTVYERHEEEQIVAYQVSYRYNDEDYSVRMGEDPGERIRVVVRVEPVL